MITAGPMIVKGRNYVNILVSYIWVEEEISWLVRSLFLGIEDPKEVYYWSVKKGYDDDDISRCWGTNTHHKCVFCMLINVQNWAL